MHQLFVSDSTGLDPEAHELLRAWHTKGEIAVTIDTQAYIVLIQIDGVFATAVIGHSDATRHCGHGRRENSFSSDAGLDSLAISRAKRNGRESIVARAFGNAVHYVFANSVGPQGGGKWSAGDSKIVAADERVLALADNQNEAVIVANLDLSRATGSYALRGMKHPRFLAADWKRMVKLTTELVCPSSAALQGFFCVCGNRGTRCNQNQSQRPSASHCSAPFESGLSSACSMASCSRILCAGHSSFPRRRMCAFSRKKSDQISNRFATAEGASL